MASSEGDTWGNLPQYYMETKIDLETGEPLGTPEITEEPEATEKTEVQKNIDMTKVVTANSALSEYIARNVIEFNTSIDISEFPEAADTNVVTDAFFEAMYQNPLALGVQSVSMDSNYVLHVEYEDDTETALKKQREVVEKVDEVVKEIITDDMSDLEKNHAINQYLCENTEYDFEALENAEENENYQTKTLLRTL